MSISTEVLLAAIDALAQKPGLIMDPDALAEDVVLLVHPWPEEIEFSQAIASTLRAIDQLAQGKVTPAPLKYDLEGWYSYHYQHRRGQNIKADMRIVFQPDGQRIRVLGFGHRSIPLDFYERIIASRELV